MKTVNLKLPINGLAVICEKLLLLLIVLFLFFFGTIQDKPSKTIKRFSKYHTSYYRSINRNLNYISSRNFGVNLNDSEKDQDCSVPKKDRKMIVALEESIDSFFNINPLFLSTYSPEFQEIVLSERVRIWNCLTAPSWNTTISELSNASSNFENSYNELSHLVRPVSTVLFPWFNHNSSQESTVMDLLKTYSGAGIVLLVNDQTLVSTLSLIKYITASFSPLQIQVFYLDSYSLTYKSQQHFRRHCSFELIDLSTHFNLSGQAVHILPFALLASKFRRVLYIESSTIPLLSPKILFNLSNFDPVVELRDDLESEIVESMAILDTAQNFNILLAATFTGLGNAMEVFEHYIFPKRKYLHNSERLHCGKTSFTPIAVTGNEFSSTLFARKKYFDSRPFKEEWKSEKITLHCMFLPLNFPLTARRIRDAISSFKQIFMSLRSQIITQPARLSPWSYDSVDCKPDMLISQFEGWNSEKYPIWAQFSNVELLAHQRALAIQISAPIQTPERVYQGRGIVYSCHPKIFAFTFVSIRFLRHYGCVLPVEIWCDSLRLIFRHWNELNNTLVDKFKSIEGVEVYNLAEMGNIRLKRDKDGKIYALKTAALIHSNLDEILFLDGDNFPLRDPTFLFDTPAFKETGAIFWRDFWKTRPDNPIWNIMGISCVDEFEQESGQMVIKKNANGVLKALEIAYYFQQESAFYYHLTLGDKDTFRFSWRILNLPYHMVRAHLAALGPKKKPFCGKAMVQYEPFWGEHLFGPYPGNYTETSDPLVLFIHGNALKYGPAPAKNATKIFGILHRYKRYVSRDGIGRVYGSWCADLKPSNSDYVFSEEFDHQYPEFEDLFAEFYIQ